MSADNFTVQPRFKRWLFPRIIRRFRHAEDGVTAIEFAMVGGPFFFLLFAIVESALFFFAGQVLENGIDAIGRDIRTGEISGNRFNKATFRDEVCNRVTSLFNCAKINVDLSIEATFSALPPEPEPDENGVLDSSNFDYDTPCPGKITLLRVTYEWPIYSNFAAHGTHGGGLANLAGGKALLNAAAVFRTEAYPTPTGC